MEDKFNFMNVVVLSGDSQWQGNIMQIAYEIIGTRVDIDWARSVWGMKRSWLGCKIVPISTQQMITRKYSTVQYSTVLKIRALALPLSFVGLIR